MNEQKTLLNKLLDKYERSTRFTEEKVSPRRILLKAGKKNWPEYQYENPYVRDAFNQATESLAAEMVLSYSWEREGKVLKEVWLNPDQLEQAYSLAGRTPLQNQLEEISSILQQSCDQCKTPCW